MAVSRGIRAAVRPLGWGRHIGVRRVAHWVGYLPARGRCRPHIGAAWRSLLRDIGLGPMRPSSGSPAARCDNAAIGHLDRGPRPRPARRSRSTTLPHSLDDVVGRSPTADSCSVWYLPHYSRQRPSSRSHTAERTRVAAIRWSVFGKRASLVPRRRSRRKGHAGFCILFRCSGWKQRPRTCSNGRLRALENNAPLLLWCFLLLFVVLQTGVRLPLCRLLMLLLLLCMAFAHRRHTELLGMLTAPILLQPRSPADALSPSARSARRRTGAHCCTASVIDLSLVVASLFGCQTLWEFFGLRPHHHSRHRQVYARRCLSTKCRHRPHGIPRASAQ